MIAKQYRLKEREVKKVLKKGKPFFSYNIVFNVLPSRLDHTRFAIVISGKSVPTNVVRNSYRRMFYKLSSPYIERNLGDIVCVVKNKTKLGNTKADMQNIQKEMNYLFEKRLGKNT